MRDAGAPLVLNTVLPWVLGIEATAPGVHRRACALPEATSQPHLTHLLGLVPNVLLQRVWRQRGQTELEVRPKILIHVDARAGCERQGRRAGLVLLHEEGGGCSGQRGQGAFGQHRGSFEHLQAGLLPTWAEVPHHQL